MSLSSYMSDTHSQLVEHGYNADLSWQVVTQVVHNMFTMDMDKERSFVRERLDTKSAKRASIAMIWGVLKTHAVMSEYTKRGIGNHPSVAFQYVKFLILNHTLLASIAEIKQVAKEAKVMLSSASNGLDQLKKSLKKS